jgi:hypothetical protein
VRHDLARDVAGVDRVARRHDRGGATARGVRGLDRDEPAEEIAELALHEQLTHLRRPAVREEHRRARRPLPDAVLQHRDRSRETGIHREAVAELDRRGQDVGEREPAVPRERGEPRVACRGRDGARRADRHVVAVLRAVAVEIERGGPAPEPIDALRPGHTWSIHDDRRDTAEVGEVAFDHVERDARRDAGVDGAAPAREHPQSGQRREVVARADHVLRTEDRRPALGDRERRRGALDPDIAHPFAR